MGSGKVTQLAQTLLATDEALVYISLGEHQLVHLEGGREVELPDIPFPVRRADLEAYEGTQELPLQVLVDGVLAALVFEKNPDRSECYRRFLFTVEPNVDQLLVAQGLTFAREDQVERARDRFEELVHLCPDHAQGWMNLGLCLLDLIRQHKGSKNSLQAQAFKAFSKAVEVDDRLAAAHFYLGCLYRDRSEHGQARKCWRRCVSLQPRDDEVAVSARNLLAQFEERRDLDQVFELGCLAVFEGRLEEAERLLRRCTSSRPKCWQSWFFLGLAERLRGEYEKAADSFGRVTSLKPDESEGFNELGLCQLERGDLESAADSLKRAQELQPDNPRLLCNMGLLELRRGAMAEAKAHFLTAQGLDPESVIAEEYLRLVEEFPVAS